MRTLGLLCCALVLVACEKPKEQPAADTTAAMAPAPAPAPAPVSLADVAGKWTMRVMPENSDSAVLTYEMVADSNGFTMNFPKRKPVKAKVTASGDSLIAEAGPYESMLRKGIQVKTNSVLRLKDGKLEGTTVAHYETKGPDTVRTLHTEGTKAQ
jgi:hypothetical protein